MANSFLTIYRLAMPRTDTPLRYPGGKSQLTPLIIEVLRENRLFYGEYIEPFAGGAGIAMTLLLNDYVSRIHLNDIDKNIYAFWHSILNNSDLFCQKIYQTDVTLDEWYRQKALFASADSDDLLTRGFATFFLNRTNRSGILNGGIIGGKRQDGQDKLDCRFNKNDLIRKITRIAKYKRKIHLSSLDAAAFLSNLPIEKNSRSLINIDPPYFKKGPGLYTSFYKPGDHRLLQRVISTLPHKWMVTYDNEQEIIDLYREYRITNQSLNYSAQTKRIGSEIIIFSDNLSIPSHISENGYLNRNERIAA